MKNRILTAVIAIIICLVCAVSAFANEISGYFTSYNITVTSESGAVLYDQVWNDDMTRSIMRPLTVLVPVATQLTVTDELEFDGEIYLAVEYDDFSAYVKQSKTTINVQNVGEEAAYPTYSERSIIIINKDGVSLRKGPSFAYDITGETIPYGTTVNYSLTNCETEAYARWAYTEYNGVTGWLYIYQYGINSNYDCAYVLDKFDQYTGSLITLTDETFLTETPNSSSAKTIENIPKGTPLSYKYYYEYHDSIAAYVEYNGFKGWLRTKYDSHKAATGEKGGVYVLAENGLPLYSNAFDENDKPVTIVPSGTNLCVDYVFWDADTNGEEIFEYKWMHVNYNGTDGWLFSSDASEYCYMGIAFDLKITADGGLNLYSLPSSDSEVISAIPKDTAVTCIYEISETKDTERTYWSYVKYGNNHGWIYSTEAEAAYVEGSEKQMNAPFGAQPVESEKVGNAPDIEISKNTQKDNVNNKINNAKTVLIICACAAAIAAAIAVAVVIKKKKSK